MCRRRLLGSAFLVSLLAPLLAMTAAPAQADPVQLLFPTCQDIRTHLLRVPDGDYMLSNNGRIFTVYCYDMAGAPREYLNLASVGSNVNYSQYTAGGAAPGTDVRTAFSKLRVDPATLTVDTGDLTFASSTGSLFHGGQQVTAMPYGVAMSCLGFGNTQGIGNVDLRGTPFQVDNGFLVGGYQAAGAANISPDNQLVDLHGGGYCGWEAPAPAAYNPFNPLPGEYHLKLSCAQNPVVTAQRQFCVQAG